MTFAFPALLRRELRSWLLSPVLYAYCALFAFFSLASMFLLSGFIETNEAELAHSFFSWHPWIFAMIAPVIGIRSWSEENHCGVFEVLGTQPIRMGDLVLAKASGGFSVIALSLALSLPAVFTVLWLGNPDVGAILSGYFGSFLCGCAFVAVSQAVCAFMNISLGSFVCSVALCLALVTCGIAGVANVILGTFPKLDWLTHFLAAISVMPKYQSFCEGRIELAAVSGFFLLIASSLLVCMRALLVQRGSSVRRPLSRGGFAYGVPIGWMVGFYLSLALGATYLPVRLDVTSGRRFSLPSSVARALESLQRKVTIRLFATAGHPQFGFDLASYERRIREMVTQLTEKSPGNITFEILDPNRDPAAARIAAVDEVRSVSSDNGDPFMFGMVVESVGRKRVFDVLDPKREQYLSADLVQAVLDVGRAERKTIGILSPFAANRDDPLLAKNWSGIEILKKGYDLTRLDATADWGHPAVVVLLHPTIIEPALSSKLEAYVRQGGDLVVLVDPFSLVVQTFASSGSLALQSSHLPDFIERRGIKLVENRVVYDRLLGTEHAIESGSEWNPAILTLGPDQFNPNHPITEGFDLIHFCYAGALEVSSSTGYETLGLIRTSPQAMLLDAKIAIEEKNNSAKVTQAMGSVEPRDSGFPLMVLQQSNRDEKEGRLLVASDADWLYGTIAGRVDENGKLLAFNANLGLMQNIADFFTGDRSLRELRMRSLAKRPLWRWDAMRESLGEPFRVPLANLSREIGTLESDLRRIGSSRQLTSAQGRENARIEHQISELNIRLGLRRSEVLGLRARREAGIRMRLNTIKWINILAVPLLVAAAGVAVTSWRARKIQGAGT